MKPSLCAVCVFALLLAVSLRAQAQAVGRDDERVPRDSPSESTDEWYGWQTLSSDAASIGLLIVQGSINDGPPVLGVVALGGYVLGAPLIQFAHGNRWAAPSLGLRLGSLALIAAGAVVALSGGCFVIFGEQPSGCDTREAAGGLLMLGGLIAIPVAITLDAVKAHEKRAPDRATPQLGMWADPTRGSLGFSLVMAD